MLTIAFATGTEPAKWFRRYEALTGRPVSGTPSADPFALLSDGPGGFSGSGADAALMRLPDSRVGEQHHVVRLYEEAQAVAVPKDSVFAEVGGSVLDHDLAGEHLNFDYYDDHASPGLGPAEKVDELRAALQVVAANVGFARGPLPLLRALSKKQVSVLELAGAQPATAIGLVWLKERDAEDVQDFVGVAKGRTPRSSRGTAAGGKPARNAGGHKTPSQGKQRGGGQNSRGSGGKEHGKGARNSNRGKRPR